MAVEASDLASSRWLSAPGTPAVLTLLHLSSSSLLSFTLYLFRIPSAGCAAPSHTLFVLLPSLAHDLCASQVRCGISSLAGAGASFLRVFLVSFRVLQASGTNARLIRLYSKQRNAV